MSSNIQPCLLEKKQFLLCSRINHLLGKEVIQTFLKIIYFLNNENTFLLISVIAASCKVELIANSTMLVNGISSVKQIVKGLPKYFWPQNLIKKNRRR